MSGRQINRANWTAARIQAFKRFLNGDTNAKFRGAKPNGEMYKKELSVRTLVAYYEPMKFSTRKGKLFVTSGDTGTREIITDDQVASKARQLYQHKETGLGKAPSIYNFMKTKYANVGYKKVERAIQSLPAYQKYQARHVRKPKTRKVIISKGPGENIDTDVMKFSSQYFRPSHNEGFDALAIVVDRFSGYIAVAPLKATQGGKTADVVSDVTARMIQSSEFPSKRGGTIFHDNGVEYREIFPEKMRQIGYNDVVISAAAGAPSAHAERAVGIIRGLVNNKLTSGGQRPRKYTQRWWPLAKTLVRGYNATPMTDARAPYSPNQLKKMTGRKRAEIVRLMMEQGAKKVRKAPGRTDPNTGAKVSKQLKILKVGDTVRYAIENVRKTGADKRPYPKQRWSEDTHTVQRVVKRKLGFASYVLSGLPRRRFEREDLQGPL